MTRRSTRVRARGEFGGSVLLAVCVAAAVEAWNKTANWFWVMLAAVSPLILLVKGMRWYFRKRALLESGIEAIDNMSGVEFEELLLVHFQAQGYTGTLTAETGDYGADLVLEKEGRKLVVQAKRWRAVVGIEAVQQVIGAIKFYGAAKGMVVTNSVFTENAYALAHANGIELVDREKLMVMLRKSQQKMTVSWQGEMTEPQADEPTGILPDKTCPMCGKILVARNGIYGLFIGCSGYPACRFTRQA